ncbi:MAG: TonB-dependent receptor [Terricaulis sp.]|nr:TonB-dependent receptor [Terricaulis sp.]
MRKIEESVRGALKLSTAIGLAFGLGAMCFAPQAAAQGIVGAASDEIVVTGLKHGERNVQDVPVAITAYGAEQLEALNFTNLQSLSYSIPNVQFEDVGTTPGVANFGIRGLGINSSIPSVDPTVGVFVDGMYMGINAGILTDSFDLAGVEVLRGPQGVLFGRNVTGGAVVLRTRAPSDELEIRARAGVETGLNYTADMSISGPLAPGLLSAKFAAYYNDDEGWFENLHDGSQHGANNTQIYRGALRLTPAPGLEFLLRAEHGESESDGPAGQNHGLYSRDSFDFSINNRGYANGDWEQIIFETNWDVGFGGGTITNIAAWRSYDGTSGGDIDATSNTAFHARAVNEQEQWSNELRYAGTFGPVDIVAGHYWFKQELLYIEERYLLGGQLPVAGPLQYAAPALFWINRVGGGQGEFSTWGAFVNADWRINDRLTFNFGIRYTEEEKTARVSRIRRGPNTPVSQPITVAPVPQLLGLFILPTPDVLDPGVGGVLGSGVVGGNIDSRTLAFSDQPFDLSWNDTSPRIGVQWRPMDGTNLYAFAAKGFRSGGVNFRVTTLGLPACPAVGCDPANPTGAQPPTAFDSEEQTSFEIGWKQDFLDGRARINLAVFHNEIEGMQRETNLPGPSGVQQVIVNAGDATIQGAELEARFAITSNFMVQLQAGYTHGEYDRITADLNGDGVVNAADASLEIPRLAPWTYGVSLLHDLPIGFGVLSTRLSYNHRDANYYTDNNRGVLNEADIVDLNFTFRPDQGPWSVSLYGLNLTDEVTFGGDTQLPDNPFFGGDGNPANGNPTFSPLNKGRVIGAELRLSF